jgi:membrane-bound lytic murein transglycosylase B
VSCRALISVALAAAFWCSSAPAQADLASPDPESIADEPSTRRDQATALSLAEIVRGPQIIHAEVLAGLRAGPELLGPLGRNLRSLRSDIEAARSSQRWAVQERQLRQQTVEDNRAQLALRSRELSAAVAGRERAEGNLRAMSVDAFITGSDQPDLAALIQAEAETAASMATQSLRTDHLARSATDDLMGRRDLAVAIEDRATRELASARLRVAREQQLLDEAAGIEIQSTAVLAELEPQLGPAERRFERWLLTQTIPGDEDLTVVAVNAYYNASEIAFQRWPGCRIGWHQLAGVGRVESFHGRFGSSRLSPSGATSTKILGPQLNGDQWLAIPDTDGGELDEDTEWDRAVGPMQFIPTSWAIFAADGNSDGRKDPHNLYDAALAAADHLCGDGLDSADRFQQALMGYNRSARYGFDVMRFADAYAGISDIATPWDVEPDDQPDMG